MVRKKDISSFVVIVIAEEPQSRSNAALPGTFCPVNVFPPHLVVFDDLAPTGGVRVQVGEVVMDALSKKSLADVLA